MQAAGQISQDFVATPVVTSGMFCAFSIVLLEPIIPAHGHAFDLLNVLAFVPHHDACNTCHYAA
jgi:hypothetical protein